MNVCTNKSLPRYRTLLFFKKKKTLSNLLEIEYFSNNLLF